MTTQHEATGGSLNDRVAMELRVLMLRTDARQIDLAPILGITQGQVSKRLRALVPFTLDEIEQLAAFFGVSPAALLGHAESPRPGGPGGGLSLLSERRARRDPNPQPSDLEWAA